MDNDDNSFHQGRIHSDYGQALDAEIVRLRMEVNMQQKNLFEQINLTKFKAKQAAQERDLAKNDLDRLIQSVKNKTNRYNSHEKPIRDLQTVKSNKLGSERLSGKESSHSRRNLDTYQKLFTMNFNNMKYPPSSNYAHNDNDPFNINVEVPSQPKMYYNGGVTPNPYGGGNLGPALKTNSQAIGIEIQNKNPSFSRPKPDPLAYGMREFDHESSYALNQIGKFWCNCVDSMISTGDAYQYDTKGSRQPTNARGHIHIDDEMHSESRQVQPAGVDIHHQNMQQLDSVLDSIVDE